MKLLYISHPCTSFGDIEGNRISAREYADAYKSQGYHVINPLDCINPNADHEEAMQVALNLLAGCDAIAMCGEWWRSKGCKKEYEFAVANGIEVIKEGE